MERGEVGATTIDDRAPADVQRPARTALVFALCFGLPLLLCVPVVLALRYDTGVRNRATALLAAEIAPIDARKVDLNELHRTKSRLLTRKSVIEQLDLSIVRTPRALAVMTELPAGVQLVTFEAKGRHLSFVARCGGLATELGVIETLARNGYGELRLTERKPEPVAGFERVTFEATLNRSERE